MKIITVLIVCIAVNSANQDTRQSTNTIQHIKIQQENEQNAGHLIWLKSNSDQNENQGIHSTLFAAFLGPASLVGGTLFRVLVFREIKRGGVLNKPINLMILVDELTKVIGYGCGLLTIMLGNISDRPVVDILGPHYCHMFDYLVNLAGFTGVTGGASIALLRLLFVTANHTLKYRLGLMPTTIVLMLVTHVSSHVITYLWIAAPQPNRLMFLN